MEQEKNTEKRKKNWKTAFFGKKKKCKCWITVVEMCWYCGNCIEPEQQFKALSRCYLKAKVPKC